MKHKHYDIIVAWAAGILCQYQDGGDNWKDLPLPSPHDTFPAFFDDIKYRIKPETKKYRIALLRVGNSIQLTWPAIATFDEQAKRIEANPGFVCWISDWVSYEVTE